MVGEMERADLRQAFVEKCGLNGAEITPLAADASFRSYHRVLHNGEPMVLMDAPPPKEDIRPFCAVAQRLCDLGFSAPKMLGRDVEQGFLLLEDFGNGTFTNLLADGADEAALYDLATDVLIALHKMPDPDAPLDGHDLPDYDADLYLKETSLLPDWFLPSVGMMICENGRREYDAAWLSVLPEVNRLPQTLVLRDFHVDNLMQLPNREGVAACGLLDFQDAVRGSVLYDVMSLLEDARRDIHPDLISRAKQKYLSAFQHIDPEDFNAVWAVLAAQRHAKVIGIFARLHARDNKPNYLVHIPRVWSLLETALGHPVLAPVKRWFDEHVPTDVRRRLPG